MLYRHGPSCWARCWWTCWRTSWRTSFLSGSEGYAKNNVLRNVKLVQIHSCLDAIAAVDNQPRKLFLAVRKASISAESDVDESAFIASLRKESVSSEIESIANIPNLGALQTHKWVPFLLVPNCGQPRRNRVRTHELFEPRDISVLGLDGFRKCKIALRVLVSVVCDRLVGQRPEITQRGMHLLGRALEEAPATSDEERVASEDATGMRRVRRVGGVKADRVLRMARRRESANRHVLPELEHVSVFDDLGCRRRLVRAGVDDGFGVFRREEGIATTVVFMVVRSDEGDKADPEVVSRLGYFRDLILRLSGSRDGCKARRQPGTHIEWVHRGSLLGRVVDEERGNGGGLHGAAATTAMSEGGRVSTYAVSSRRPHFLLLPRPFSSLWCGWPRACSVMPVLQPISEKRQLLAGLASSADQAANVVGNLVGGVLDAVAGGPGAAQQNNAPAAPGAAPAAAAPGPSAAPAPPAANSPPAGGAGPIAPPANTTPPAAVGPIATTTTTSQTAASAVNNAGDDGSTSSDEGDDTSTTSDQDGDSTASAQQTTNTQTTNTQTQTQTQTSAAQSSSAAFSSQITSNSGAAAGGASTNSASGVSAVSTSSGNAVESSGLPNSGAGSAITSAITTSSLSANSPSVSQPQTLGATSVHAPNAAAVAGGVLGALVLLALATIGLVVFLRKRQMRKAPSAEFLTVYPPQSPFARRDGGTRPFALDPEPSMRTASYATSLTSGTLTRTQTMMSTDSASSGTSLSGPPMRTRDYP
ncbi:hypothetical protein HMN09_00034900 [Mycena chlorophos]|uniref:Uncharacterized protein n=1 Tax=Mycena chlorophos TaxID=658473 RepID=A0A8H6TT23_MYCCL|nr:hypothetical protein HMN09_00034900 [Mycena chlorophos]